MASYGLVLMLLIALPGAFASFCLPAGFQCKGGYGNGGYGAACCGTCGYNGVCINSHPPVFQPPPKTCFANFEDCSGPSRLPCCNGGVCQNRRCGIPPPPPLVCNCQTQLCCRAGEQCIQGSSGRPTTCVTPTPPPVVPPPVVPPPVVPQPPPPVDFTGCACKKPLSITLRYIGSGAITVDLDDFGGKGTGRKKSGKGKKRGKKSGRGTGKKRRGFTTNTGSRGIVTVRSGETFTLNGPFGSRTQVGNAEIHTSCSDVLGVGQTFCGQFELVAGRNTQGTSLCPTTQPQRKGKCF